jgi:hypothetical protein
MLILENGTKKDALRIWFDIGTLLNEIADRYNIIGTSDEPYFWQAIYNHVSPLIQRSAPPQNSSSNKNHFRLCARYMAAKWDWKFVSGVGNWSVWRDLFDNSRLLDDPRIFEWVVEVIHGSGLGHKKVRPFVHEVRRSIKNKDTTVLSDKELAAKLQPLLVLIPSEE